MTMSRSPSEYRLFPLVPFGRGTGQIESLTGYITRQAREHSISTGRLLTEAIEPLIRLYPPRASSPGGRRTTPWHGDQRAINGTGERSGAWLAALEQLTEMGDLSELTVRSWSAIMPAHYMLRSGAGYCPACFQADLEYGHPYERLIWAVHDVHTCVVHGTRLRSKCPRCARLLPSLAPWSVPGNCPYCGRWLGERLAGDTTIDPWQTRVASLIEHALARRFDLGSIEGVRRSLAVAIDVVGDGNRAHFARMVGVTPSAAHDWFSRSRPTLRTLIRVAVVIGSDLPAILAGEPHVGLFPPMRLPVDVPSERHRVISWPRVQAALAAEAEKEQPASLNSFLQTSGLDKTNVRKRASPAARTLVVRAQARRKERVERRRDALVQEVETIVAGLRERGLVASRRNVESLLPPGVSLREAALHEAWRQIR